jgi:hypothetical protein
MLPAALLPCGNQAFGKTLSHFNDQALSSLQRTPTASSCSVEGKKDSDAYVALTFLRISQQRDEKIPTPQAFTEKRAPIAQSTPNR